MSQKDSKTNGPVDDKLATNSPEGETPKDDAGITGGKYVDPDPNPAFHGEQGTPATEGSDGTENLPTHAAYEEDAPGLPGHVAP